MLTWRYWSSNIRRISCSFGCWARSAKWADSTASPESFVMRNPRGRNSFAGSLGGPNHEYSSTGGVRVVAAARPRSSAVAICSARGWSSMACARVGATHMMISAPARKVIMLASSRRYVPSPLCSVKVGARHARAPTLAGSDRLVYTERRYGVATHQAGDRAADAGDPAYLLPGLPEGPLPEHHILHRRVGSVHGVQRDGPLRLPQRGEVPEGSSSHLH